MRESTPSGPLAPRTPQEIQPWEILQQTRWWRTKDQGWVRVKDMTLQHKRHLLAWLERRPRNLVAIHTAEVDRASRQAMHWVANHDGGEMAHESLERMADDLTDAWAERYRLWKAGEAECMKWLLQTPLYKRLQSDIERGKGAPE